MADELFAHLDEIEDPAERLHVATRLLEYNNEFLEQLRQRRACAIWHCAERGYTTAEIRALSGTSRSHVKDVVAKLREHMCHHNAPATS